MLTSSLLLVLTSSLGILAIPWTDSPFFPASSPYSEWIPASGFNLTSKWSMPENTCFEEHMLNSVHDDTYYKWDPQSECSICKGAVNAAGFHGDPNDCSKFFHCAKDAYGNWVPYHKQCPKCQFWDQEDLTCRWVYQGAVCFPTTTEGPTTPTTPTTPSTTTESTPAPIPTYLDTCVTFDHGWNKIQGLKWIWVWGQNVKALNSAQCLNGGKCGYFNGNSKLEIPRFSNAFRYQSSFSVSLFYKRKGGRGSEQGIVSNGCFTDQLQYDEASSVFVSSSVGNKINAGVRGMDGTDAVVYNTYSAEEDWHHVVLSWNSTNVNIYHDKLLISSTSFTGPLRNSHCPLVIGDFINSQDNNKFIGYIDEICIFRKGLTQQEVNDINLDPSYAYDI